MSNPESLTTGEAAKYCHVSQTTIINWIKRGKLKAYTTVGGHHRIMVSDFITFLEENGMPGASDLRRETKPVVLAVGDQTSTEGLKADLATRVAVSVVTVTDDYEAVAAITKHHPAAVILDVEASTVDALALCRWLYMKEAERQPPVIAVGEPQHEEAARSAGAQAYLTPAAQEKLAAVLEGLLTQASPKTNRA